MFIPDAEEITNLRQMRTLLEAIINSTQDAISVVDEHGIGLMINPAYTAMTGLTAEDIINKPATVDIAEGESMHYQVLRTRTPVRGVRMKVGPARKEVMVNVAPIICDGQLKGSVGIIHDLSEIKKLTEELEDTKRLLRKLEASYTFADIVGESSLLLDAIELALKAAPTPATVLLRGESGTGKELFAHAIHNASPRKQKGFIRVNCSAIPENLLESELFGYEEGAFTGASKGGKLGLFEQATGGTLFMDEIGEVSLHLQTKLLRVLQEKEIRRIGGAKAIPVDVRIIAATNANLEQKIQEGTFREDLYYRINVFPILIPALRQRKQDIDQLARFFIRKFNQEYGRKVTEIRPEVIEMLKDYNWPGNVRELANVIGRAIINMQSYEEVIRVGHLPVLNHPKGLTGNFAENKRWAGVSAENDSSNLEEILRTVEKQVIWQTLQQCQGNKTKAARRLGLSIRSLYYKLDRHGLR